MEKYLLKGKNREAASSLDKPEFVGFYMSASWCGPCRNFTPKLKEFYEKLQNRDQKLEIVFCTNDRNENEFQEYFAKMPWLAVPMNNSKALHESWQAYPANGIPKLTIVNNKTMKVVTEGGVADITRNLSDPEKLIKEWEGEKTENKPNPVVKNEEKKIILKVGLGI